ncbi:MAG: sugar nucleotide-binding protein [Bacteroidales bacterium]|jgi:dTDP-4-dehydrorhamnose reductase|nr:sugar nucleotide-binding protein [Bacteroidales bacterium]
MKILITGSNGLTGQAILQETNSADSPTEIIACSKSPNRFVGKHKFELLDLRYPEKLNYLLDVYQPEAIINTAAISQIDECEKNKITCHQINYEAVLNLIQSCTERNIHLTHISTDFVFDGNQQVPYAEPLASESFQE